MEQAARMMGTQYENMVCIHCMTYNQEKYIEDTLKGFVMQKTDFPFIAAVFDDFSTDGTADIIRRYEKEYPSIIKGVYLPENYYSQRKSKLGLLKPFDATAKYVAICEGDDYWTDEYKLQKQVDFLEAHDDFVLCCTAFTLTYNGREDDKTVVRFDKDVIRLEDLLQEYWIGTLTTVLKSELFTAFRRPFDDLPMSDLPLWCFLATKGRIKYLPDVTANYRQLSTSACHFVDPKKQYKFRLDAMRVREYYAQAAGKTAVAAPAFSKHAHFILDECYRNGWLDFPMDRLWHFVEEYGHPSGYDRLKCWGLRSAFRLRLSKKLFDFLKRKVK